MSNFRPSLTVKLCFGQWWMTGLPARGEWRHRTCTRVCCTSHIGTYYNIIWKACPSVGQIPDILTVSIGPVMNLKLTDGWGRSKVLAGAILRVRELYAVRDRACAAHNIIMWWYVRVILRAGGGPPGLTLSNLSDVLTGLPETEFFFYRIRKYLNSPPDL